MSNPNPKHYDVIIRPIITEKSTLAGEHNRVVFEVRKDATKPEIRRAVEAIFGVKVEKVNTLIVKGKTKRRRGLLTRRSDWKKAYVKLAPGHSIDVTTGI